VDVTQALVQWSGLPDSSATWEDHSVLQSQFPSATAWGQSGSSAGVLSPPSITRVTTVKVGAVKLK
jgi:hypothetical protein